MTHYLFSFLQHKSRVVFLHIHKIIHVASRRQEKKSPGA